MKFLSKLMIVCMLRCESQDQLDGIDHLVYMYSSAFNNVTILRNLVSKSMACQSGVEGLFSGEVSWHSRVRHHRVRLTMLLLIDFFLCASLDKVDDLWWQISRLTLFCR